MSATVDAALEPDLARLIEAMEASGWSGEVVDARWRLRWVGEETRILLGGLSDEALGVGRSFVRTRTGDPLEHSVVFESQLAYMRTLLPIVLADGVEREQLRADLGPAFAHLLDEVQPAPAPPAWTGTIEIVIGEPPPIGVRYLALRAHRADGELIGTAFVYGAAMPARVSAWLTRGSAEMFARMARLAVPGRREAAILFADVQASSELSRHVSSAAYFELVRRLTTAIDDRVDAGVGVVGKHAGDGASAFFLAEDLGSASAAARSALEAARAIAAIPEDDGVRLNVGVHWGATLYMGQIVTGGRLEVTALGDEVNECARIQQSARDGTILVSKTLIERLSEDDAAAVGVDPVGMSYRALAELPGVDEKAVRDAGGVPVCELPPR
jgi:class 3 adenylate cyclase